MKSVSDLNMFNYPQLYVYAERSIQWSLKSIYPFCNFVSDVESFSSCTDNHFILIQVQSRREIHELVWDKIRIQLQKLSPVIIIGYQSKTVFLQEPYNLVFQERPYEYRYLSLPICLKEFFTALAQMQPIYDDLTLKSQIKRYASLEGLIATHLHHINNFIYREDLSSCKAEFNRIIPLLQLAGFGDISSMVEAFDKNPSLNQANEIKKIIEKLINGK